MKNQETFVDLTLIRCFHEAHIDQHFDWLHLVMISVEMLGSMDTTLQSDSI